MGGMMGTTGTTDAWVLLWILLALALGIPGGVLIARGLRTRRNAEPHQGLIPPDLLPPPDTAPVREAPSKRPVTQPLPAAADQ